MKNTTTGLGIRNVGSRLNAGQSTLRDTLAREQEKKKAQETLKYGGKSGGKKFMYGFMSGMFGEEFAKKYAEKNSNEKDVEEAYNTLKKLSQKETSSIPEDMSKKKEGDGEATANQEKEKIDTKKIIEKLDVIVLGIEKIEKRLAPKDVTVGKGNQKQTYRYDPLAPAGRQVTEVTQSGKAGALASKKGGITSAYERVISKAAYFGNETLEEKPKIEKIKSKRKAKEQAEKMKREIAAENKPEQQKTSETKEPAKKEKPKANKPDKAQAESETTVIQETVQKTFKEVVEEMRKEKEAMDTIKYGGKSGGKKFMYGFMSGMLGEDFAKSRAQKTANVDEQEEAFKYLLEQQQKKEAEKKSSFKRKTPPPPTPTQNNTISTQTTEQSVSNNVIQVANTTSNTSNTEVQPTPAQQIPENEVVAETQPQKTTDVEPTPSQQIFDNKENGAPASEQQNESDTQQEKMSNPKLITEPQQREIPDSIDQELEKADQEEKQRDELKYKKDVTDKLDKIIQILEEKLNESGGGIFSKISDLLGNLGTMGKAARGAGALARGARGAASMVGRGAMAAARFAGPAAAVAGAGYAGYKAGEYLNDKFQVSDKLLDATGAGGASVDEQVKSSGAPTSEAEAIKAGKTTWVDPKNPNVYHTVPKEKRVGPAYDKQSNAKNQQTPPKVETQPTQEPKNNVSPEAKAMQEDIAREETSLPEGKSEQAMVADEPVVESKPLSRKQMIAIERGISSGIKYPTYVMQKYNIQKQVPMQAKGSREANVPGLSNENAELRTQSQNKDIRIALPRQTPQVNIVKNSSGENRPTVIQVRNYEPSVATYVSSIFDHPVTHPGIYKM